jgi:hypothetical protein
MPFWLAVTLARARRHRTSHHAELLRKLVSLNNDLHMLLAGQGRAGEAEPLLVEVAMEPEIADRARLAIERMMAIG